MQYAELPSRGAATYFEQIRRFPMLEAEDEYALAARSREQGDRSAAHQLVNSHLRLVAKIAIGYRGYGLPSSDLISEGNIGLLEAVGRFDESKGVRFSAYAVWWIRAAIQSYILRSWSLVKMGTTVNQKKLFFNLAKAKRRVSALQEGDLRPDQVTLIANELGVTERDTLEMNRRMSGDVSLNVRVNEEGNSVEWQDLLVDEGSDQESRLAQSEDLEVRRRALGAAIAALDDRDRRILEGRRLIDPPLTLDELAIEFRISRERVRQIEIIAFRKVQRATRIACTRRRDPLTTRRPGLQFESQSPPGAAKRKPIRTFHAAKPISEPRAQVGAIKSPSTRTLRTIDLNQLACGPKGAVCPVS
jgi:RNA polymerase sigma-32 factor